MYSALHKVTAFGFDGSISFFPHQHRHPSINIVTTCSRSHRFHDVSRPNPSGREPFFLAVWQCSSRAASASCSLLLDTLAGQSWWTLLLDILLETLAWLSRRAVLHAHSCLTLFPRHPCLTLFLDTLAGHSFLTVLT